MSDYRLMFDSDWLHYYDIWPDEVVDAKDVVVVIEKVVAGELRQVPKEGEDKTKAKTSRKPVIHFRGKVKAYASNKTNAKIIAGLYGNDTAKWVGKSITLFRHRTKAFGEVVGCIRVRPQIPNQPAPRQPIQLTPEKIAEGRSVEAEMGGQ